MARSSRAGTIASSFRRSQRIAGDEADAVCQARARLAEPIEKSRPIAIGHANITKNRINRMIGRFQPHFGRRAAVGKYGVESELLNDFRQKLCDFDLIVNDEDAAIGFVVCRFYGERGIDNGAVFGRANRQKKDETGAAEGWCGIDIQRAAMGFDQTA